jgi:hypothetical protein
MGALTAACVWALVAAGIGFAPRRAHWPGAIVLIATGLPLLVWVGLAYPWWVVLAVALAMASVLRWPLRFLIRRAVSIFAKKKPEGRA